MCIHLLWHETEYFKIQTVPENLEAMITIYAITHAIINFLLLEYTNRISSSRGPWEKWYLCDSLKISHHIYLQRLKNNWVPSFPFSVNVCSYVWVGMANFSKTVLISGQWKEGMISKIEVVIFISAYAFFLQLGSSFLVSVY